MLKEGGKQEDDRWKQDRQWGVLRWLGSGVVKMALIQEFIARIAATKQCVVIRHRISGQIGMIIIEYQRLGVFSIREKGIIVFQNALNKPFCSEFSCNNLDFRLGFY